MKYVWDENSIEILKNIYSYESWEAIFNKLDFNNKSAIQAKASKLGLKRKIRKTNNFVKGNRNKYTVEEDQYIVLNYNKMSARDIATNLNRNLNSIYNRVKYLDVKKEYWRSEDIEILKESYPLYSNKYLSEKYFINKEPHSIRRMGLKLGLHKDKEKGYKWYDKDEMLQQLKSKVEEIKRTPCSFELVEFGLPSEKTYCRYFGSYIDACLNANVNPNYGGFGNSVVSKASDGTICLSNAELKITEYFINNEIAYTKEPFYKDYIDDIRCGNKRFDWKVGNWFIEYFGMPEMQEYKSKMNEKISICNDNNIKLIKLYRSDLSCLDQKLHSLL